MTRIFACMALAASMGAGAAQADDGLPGMTGIDHVGFTVPDVATAAALFTETMGCAAFYPLGPFSRGDSSWNW